MYSSKEEKMSLEKKQPMASLLSEQFGEKMINVSMRAPEGLKKLKGIPVVENNEEPDFTSKVSPKISPLKQNSKSKGYAVERWEKELMKALSTEGKVNIKLVPVVENNEQQAFTSTSTEIKRNKKLILRTAKQATNNDTINLKQFDPNFMSPTEIYCRSPGCKQRRKRKPLSSSKLNKEDLYLCPSHRKLVEDNVAKICLEKKVDVSTKYSSEDFEGYTSMIGLLESAYFDFVKRPEKPTILSEVFINLRNFLMITNALLNPNGHNLVTALNTTMTLFLEILNNSERIANLRELVPILRFVIEHILFAFGIIYCWILRVELVDNPGTRMGAGIGGFTGMMVGAFIGGPLVGLMTLAGGSFCGGMIGSGLYEWQREQHLQQAVDNGLRRYQEYIQGHRVREDQIDQQGTVAQQITVAQQRDPVFLFTGSQAGDLILAAMFIG